MACEWVGYDNRHTSSSTVSRIATRTVSQRVVPSALASGSSKVVPHQEVVQHRLAVDARRDVVRLLATDFKASLPLLIELPDRVGPVCFIARPLHGNQIRVARIVDPVTYRKGELRSDIAENFAEAAGRVDRFAENRIE